MRTKRRNVKRAAAVVGALAVVAVMAGPVREIVYSQRADYGWRPRVAARAWVTTHPRVMIDEGHFNASTAGFAGRYWPFAQLLRADGYAVERSHEPFTSALLARAQVLVIANASGQSNPQVFGVNLPGRRAGERGDPAFTTAEIAALTAWVQSGGALLLIADHAPFGHAAAALGTAFGVTMHEGFTEVPGELSDPLLFSVANQRLGDHPILRGDGVARPPVTRVMTYTGQSLDGPPGSTILLRLPPSARESVQQGPAWIEQTAGTAQAVAFAYGRGRVVVLGEAAMLTAQVSRRVRFGMNAVGNDNQEFARGVVRWLAEAGPGG